MSQRDGGFEAHAFIGVASERIHQARFRFGEPVAIDRAQVANGGLARLRLGFGLLDLGGGSLGAAGRLG